METYYALCIVGVISISTIAVFGMLLDKEQAALAFIREVLKFFCK